MTVTREEVEEVRLENLKIRGRAGGSAPPVAQKFSRVSLSIPFATLVPDNAKYGVIRGRMLLRAPYRAAKDCIQHIARRAMQGIRITDGPVEVHAKLYMPDARRRDATNYVKLVHDSLQGTVYLDDTQIKSATWQNAGIDRENPRCEITLTARSV